MKPKFPIVQIEVQNWDLDVMIELLRFDEFYYSEDEAFYDKFFREKPFLDSNGRIFRAEEKVEITGLWSLLGLRKKYKINYKETDRRWTFEEVKSFLISKVEKLSIHEGREGWFSSLQRATTIKQLLEAER